MTASSDDSFPLSCGHRFCPQCQNEAVEQWLERQRAKLLPVDYYLVTFTVPVQTASPGLFATSAKPTIC